VCSTKTDELIEMPFGLSIRVDPKNRVLAEGPDPPNGWDNFGGHLPALANYWGVWRESHFSLGGGSDAAFSWCFSVSFLNFFCLLMHVSLLCLCVKGGQH